MTTEELIKSVSYHLFEKTLTTVCCIEFIGGTIITADATPNSRENFSEHKGRTLAYRNALRRYEPYLANARKVDIEGPVSYKTLSPGITVSFEGIPIRLTGPCEVQVPEGFEHAI